MLDQERRNFSYDDLSSEQKESVVNIFKTLLTSLGCIEHFRVISDQFIGVRQSLSNPPPREKKGAVTGLLELMRTGEFVSLSSSTVHIPAAVLGRQTAKVKTTRGDLVEYQLLSVPFYLVEQLYRLLLSS